MKTSFSKPGAPTTETIQEAVPTPASDVVVEAVTTVTPAEATAAPVTPAADIPTKPVTMEVARPVPTSVPSTSVPSYNDEEIDFGDIILPRLNIVQKVGDLSNLFTPGEIVLNQNLVIHDAKKTPAIVFTVIGFKKKQFVEKVEGGAMGALYHSQEDVVSHGGTLDYKEWQESIKTAKEKGGKALKYFQPLATALLLVERPAHVPDEDHTVFPYECEGKWHALALWSMKGTGYTNGAKTIFTARKIGHLRKEGYPSQTWTLTTKLENYGGNFAYIPVLKPGARNSPEFVAFVKDILGSGN